jgi:hypothetical protein
MMIPGRPTDFAISASRWNRHVVTGGFGVAVGLIGVQRLGDHGHGIGRLGRASSLGRRFLAGAFALTHASEE